MYCSLIFITWWSGSSKMRMMTISINTVLSPRIWWPIDWSFPMRDLLTASGMGEYFRISPILTPGAPLRWSLKIMIYVNTDSEDNKCYGLTRNCCMSSVVKTRLISSSSFAVLKPQTLRKFVI